MCWQIVAEMADSRGRSLPVAWSKNEFGPVATPPLALQRRAFAPGSTVQAQSTDAIDPDAVTVLGGVKGAFALLTGCAALDAAYARWALAFYRWRRYINVIA